MSGNQDQGKAYFFLSSGPSACPVPPSPVPPEPVLAPCPVEGAPGYLNPAKLRVSRARVLEEDRRLDVLAPITSRAEGDVAVTYQGDEIRILEPITRGQARLGTGIVNLHYLGDEDTRRQFVRLRAAANRAELDVEEISRIADRLSASGSVTDRAQGVVRLRFSYWASWTWGDPSGSTYFERRIRGEQLGAQRGPDPPAVTVTTR